MSGGRPARHPGSGFQLHPGDAGQRVLPELGDGNRETTVDGGVISTGQQPRQPSRLRQAQLMRRFLSMQKFQFHSCLLFP